MGFVFVGGEYLSIPWDHCIPRMKRKASIIVDHNHVNDDNDGCAIAGLIWYEENFGRNLIHCGAVKVSKVSGLESNDDDRMINNIWC